MADAKPMIQAVVSDLLEEVPQLKPLKLVVGIDFHGRGDLQQFRLVMPDIEVSKDPGLDAKVRVEMRRDFFNLMVEHGAKLADWHQAIDEGRVKATGIQQYLRLIAQVVFKEEERVRLRKQTAKKPSA
ncbi:MAG: hypothetical protein H0V81_17575 [Solirubrobacterales bacterium]|nr:hypothetical protein [Solirubrobacterales bacterium]